jgi:4-alpha-glucanotransferase
MSERNQSHNHLPEELINDAQALGIETTFYDALGVKQTPSEAALREILSVLVNNAKAAGVTDLASVQVIRQGRDSRLDNVCTEGGGWRLVNDKGEVASGRCDGKAARLPSELPVGSYYLITYQHGKQTTQPVVVAPARSFQPAVFDEGGRVWALAVQLYSLRSRRNWGIGDFSDLKELVRIAGELGAAGIGLNPLHAINLDDSNRISPYSPGSRLFLNLLYIDVEAIPEFPGLKAAGLVREVERLRAAPLVDYAGVIAAKLKGLRRAHKAFRKRGSAGRQPKLFRKRGSAERQADFAAFKASRKPMIDGFAAFAVLHQRFGPPWWHWPEEWRRPSPEKLEEVWRSDPVEMDFYAFVQWVADRQLAACRDTARQMNMPIGLYLDVAVGVTANGSDVWSNQGAYVRELSAGAPPDILNTVGQDWGLASFHPGVLAKTDFQVFRETLRAVMRHAGAIRLDHVLGFNRLYMIPQGFKPDQGTYVRYPFEAMLAVVAQESHAARCVVIGEDLGTVPEGFRERLADWNVWCYRVMLFERWDDGSFKASREYPEQALVSFSTHDLPTFSGWLSIHDISVKHSIGLDPGETEAARAESHQKLKEALARETPIEHPSALEVARFLARTPSRLLVIAAEDVFDVAEQVNIPGTIDEHPNWRRRLPVYLEDYLSDSRLRAVADVLRSEGRAFK